MVAAKATRIGAALVALLFTLAPVAARADAPRVNTVTVWGDTRPEVDPLRARWLFATSNPEGLGDPGAAFFRGNATPGVTVDVTATDGEKTTTKRVISAWVADPQAGVQAGDFEGDIRALTDMGVHRATGSDPHSGDPADWGPSTITFTFVAASSAGTSVGVTRTLTKFAGSRHDARAPLIATYQFPPERWCHLSGQQHKLVGMGGSARGGCSTTVGDPVQPPDVTWTLCTNPTGPAGVDNPTNNPNRPRTQANEFCTYRPQESAPTGEALVGGRVDDNSPGAYGVASEVADVRVLVYRGEEIVRDQSSLVRYGARASYGVLLRISEFEPNWPSGEPYFVEIVASDAWGNTSRLMSKAIFVYPW